MSDTRNNAIDRIIEKINSRISLLEKRIDKIEEEATIDWENFKPGGTD